MRSRTDSTAPEREELRPVVREFFGTVSDEAAVRRCADSDLGFDRTVWRRMASELGVQGLTVPESLGGAGLDWSTLGMVFEEAGRHLYGGPLLATILADAALASLDPVVSELDSWRAGFADGSFIGAVSLGFRQNDGSVTTDVDARSAGAEWAISGRCRPVIDAGAADVLVVGGRHPEGYGLFAVRTDQPAVTTMRLESLDLTRRLYDVEFIDATATLLVAGPTAVGVARHVLDLAGVGLACEQLGAMDRLLELTVAYTNDRHQFGRPIGSFQAVKHVCADMLADVEAARAAVEYTVCHVAGPDLGILSALVHAQVTEAASRTAGMALQMHGAIAYTWEHVVHLYLRRAKSAEQLMGAPSLHRERLVTLLDL